ncbi:MAG TPA: 50S ribosomal protein L3 [Candidatus Eisenbacteria bacterium]
MIGLLAQKIGMSQVYDEKGHVVPVTILAAGPCPVVQVKTSERDGYAALQIGFGRRREKLIPRPELGHMKRHNAGGLRMLREIRVEDPSAYQVGQTLTVALFEVGVKVDVVGVSKGKGFAGVVRRHHFTAGRATHGCTTHKQPGSIGASAYPSRVVKGKRLPGRMGGERVTVKNLDVIGVDPDQNLIWLRGSVPGHPNGTVLIRKNG